MEIQGRIINCWTCVYPFAGYDGKKFYKLVFTTYHAGEEGKINTDTNINTKCDWDRPSYHESRVLGLSLREECVIALYGRCASPYLVQSTTAEVFNNPCSFHSDTHTCPLSGFKTSSELNLCSTAQNFQNLWTTRNFEMPEGWHAVSSIPMIQKCERHFPKCSRKGGLSLGICSPLYLRVAVWTSVLVHWRWN